MIEKCRAAIKEWMVDDLHQGLALGAFLTIGYGLIWYFPVIIREAAPWCMVFGAAWAIGALVAMLFRFMGAPRPKWAGRSQAETRAARVRAQRVHDEQHA
jgi:hypothetical protein